MLTILSPTVSPSLKPWARLEVPGGLQGRERKYTNDRAAVKSSIEMHFPK
jgi:hypothetical protein